MQVSVEWLNAGFRKIRRAIFALLRGLRQAYAAQHVLASTPAVALADEHVLRWSRPGKLCADARYSLLQCRA